MGARGLPAHLKATLRTWPCWQEVQIWSVGCAEMVADGRLMRVQRWRSEHAMVGGAASCALSSRSRPHCTFPGSNSGPALCGVMTFQSVQLAGPA